LRFNDVISFESVLRIHGCPEISNTDQGSQFTSEEFTGKLKEYNIKISMDGRHRLENGLFKAMSCIPGSRDVRSSEIMPLFGLQSPNPRPGSELLNRAAGNTGPGAARLPAKLRRVFSSTGIFVPAAPGSCFAVP
jgi:hypothetical protein